MQAKLYAKEFDPVYRSTFARQKLHLFDFGKGDGDCCG
jgi:hypothetical protein